MPEDKWEFLKNWLIQYKESKLGKNHKNNSRYCVAISIDELLEKMEKIGNNFE